MKFHNVPASLVEECRLIEARVVGVQILTDAVIDIDVLDNFAGLPESQPGQPRASMFRRTFAAHRKSTNVISVNAETYVGLGLDERCAVMAHEIGHWVCARDGRNEYGPADVNECVIADRLACSWGYLEGLAAQRKLSSGARYAECLKKWADPSAFFACVARDRMLTLIGQ